VRLLRCSRGLQWFCSSKVACLREFVGRMVGDVLAVDGIPVRATETSGLAEGACVSTGPVGQPDRLTPP